MNTTMYPRNARTILGWRTTATERPAPRPEARFGARLGGHPQDNRGIPHCVSGLPTREGIDADIQRAEAARKAAGIISRSYATDAE